jgi:hypothetical protein
VFSRNSSKLLLTLAIVALLALGLAACGGDDSTGSTSASTTGADSNATTGGDSSSTTGADSNATTGGEKKTDSGSSSGSGTEPGSAGFIVPGGDNSIQEFGEEADSSELEAAEEALAGYLDARATENWAKSCSYLSEEALAPLKQLTEASPQLKDADCAEILEKLLASTPQSEAASPLTDGLAALRVEGDRGFALFHGAKGADYFVLMSKQGDDWAVGALLPSEFPGPVG